MTEQRLNRFRQVLSRRQRDLTVVFENVDDPHNIAACLRSCDAVGVSEVFIVTTKGKSHCRISEKASASAAKWLDIHHFYRVDECMNVVRQKYPNILTTHLSADAQSLFDISFLRPVAIVFGNEHDGLSDELLAYATCNMRIPQHGMIPSLNISVACAVTLFEAFRQRLKAQWLAPPDPQWVEEMLQRWCQRQ